MYIHLNRYVVSISTDGFDDIRKNYRCDENKIQTVNKK